MRAFYAQLFAQQPLLVAVRHGRYELFQHKIRQAYYSTEINLEDWMLPVIYQAQAITLPLRVLNADQEVQYYAQPAEEFTAVKPRYGFWGRDIEILELEETLLTERNVLLLQGMDGIGKTTLLTHLAAWWQTTHFVEQVFYFSFNVKAWTRQQILHEIAKTLLDETELFSVFQPLHEAAQQDFIVDLLRSQRHLLILNHVEYVTGTALTAQHTLDATAQAALRIFISHLVGGQSLVLLGAQGNQPWLQTGTFEQSIYHLQGLDAEAASNLVQAILQRNGATAMLEVVEQQAALQQLLKLLAGVPLALEIVLSNLPQQSPAEVLAGLARSGVMIDLTSVNKAQSMLGCIEYSYSHLSPATQQLWLCLAPFVGVIGKDFLPEYTPLLQQQPALADLPFEQWEAVLAEAHNWGMLTAHHLSAFMSIQPILPVFLQNHLQAQVELKAAIETAFRLFYVQMGYELYNFMQSTDADRQLLGQGVTRLEYENLQRALSLTLDAETTISGIYNALEAFLARTHEHQRIIELSEQILAAFADYAEAAKTQEIHYEIIMVAGNLANTYLLTRDYDKVYQSAIDRLEAIKQLEGFEPERVGYIQAIAYEQLGKVAAAQRQWPPAASHFQQALDIYITFNHRYEQAGAHHMLGSAYLEQRDLESAKSHYQQALQLYIEFNDHDGEASTYHQLGIVAHQQQQWSQAANYYQQALNIYIEFNDRYALASTYARLGIMGETLGNWEETIEYLSQALIIFTEFEDEYNRQGIVTILTRLHQQQPEFVQHKLNAAGLGAILEEPELGQDAPQATTVDLEEVSEVAEPEQTKAQQRKWWQFWKKAS